jgi:hypothetical protein
VLDRDQRWWAAPGVARRMVQIAKASRPRLPVRDEEGDGSRLRPRTGPKLLVCRTDINHSGN